MSQLRSRLRVGGGLAASIGAGIGLALSAWTIDDAAAKGRRQMTRQEAALTRPLGTPVMAVVAIDQQRVTAYDADGRAVRAPVSTGRVGYETPAGIYTVLQKRAEHYSNLYESAPMPFMQRITWSGIALHAGHLPGYPASHGCIRMPFGFAERLFEGSKLGMRVIVVRDDISPVAFAHPTLFKPLLVEAEVADAGLDVAGMATGAAPLAYASDAAAAVPTVVPRRRLRAEAAAKAEAADAAEKALREARRAARSATIESARASRMLRRATGVKVRAEQQLRRADKTLAAAEGAALERAQQAKTVAEAALATAQIELDRKKIETQLKIGHALRLRDEAKQAAAARIAAREEAREAARKLAPVSVFISRATRRLYVRQAREPAFEAPVVIADASRPLGTYVFTALAYKDADESELRWNVVSMYRSPSGRDRHTRRSRRAGPAPADRTGAAAALDRIEIPKDAARRIAALVGPGASLIVSDEGLSRETGKATEFIVVMSGEPQGGIKIRPRRAEAPSRYPRYRRSFGSPFGGPVFRWW